MATNVLTKYETNAGAIHPIVLKPVTFSAAGDPPAGAVTQSVKVQISKSKRAYGIKPRMLVLSRTQGTGELSFKTISYLPVLTPTDFNAADAQVGQTIVVGTITWTIVGRTEEDFN